jgi:hypothetical protein
MSRFRAILISAVFAAVAFAAAPRLAHADTNDSKVGYPCNLIVSWLSSSVSSAVYSGPSCSGNFVGTVWIAQSGAPTSCPASTQAAATTLQTMAQNLLQQLHMGKQIQFFELVMTNGQSCTTGINFLP